jgi:RNA polymerase sigma-70 factor (ECF subfamily)
MVNWNTELSRFMRRLMRKLMRRGVSEADAEELIQEAWVRSFEYSQKNEVRNIGAFIETTARNLAIDQFRFRRRYPHEGEDVHLLEQHLPLVSPGRNPHEVLADDQRLEQIRDALNERRKWTGDVFLAHLAGYTYRELAAAFGLSESAIEKRIALAYLWLMDKKDAG